MATLDEERYLRNLLLFGEGGMFVMRHIVEKEAENTLVTLLLSNKHLFNNVLPEQRRILYPSPTTANVDLKSWDMSILLLVMKKLLSAGLPPAVVANIAALKAYRNSLAGHPTSMSMSYTEYNTNQALIQGTLRSLAVYVNRSREIEDIIIRTESGSIDIRSVIRQIKETQAFRFDILTRIQRILDDKLNPINQKLSSMETDLKCIKETADTSKKNQEEVNKSLLLGNEGLNLKVEKLSENLILLQDEFTQVKDEIRKINRSSGAALKQPSDKVLEPDAILQESVDICKGKQEEAHDDVRCHYQAPEDSREEKKFCLAKVFETVDTSRKNQKEAHGEIKESLQSLQISDKGSKLSLDKISERIESMHNSHMQRTKDEFKKELRNIIRADCDDDEKREQATDLLFTFVKIIQDKDKYDSLEIKRIIAQRVDWYGEVTLQVMDDMIEWFHDIYHLDAVRL